MNEEKKYKRNALNKVTPEMRKIVVFIKIKLLLFGATLCFFGCNHNFEKFQNYEFVIPIKKNKVNINEIVYSLNNNKFKILSIKKQFDTSSPNTKNYTLEFEKWNIDSIKLGLMDIFNGKILCKAYSI